MSDRSHFERWTKDQLIEHAVTQSRDKEADRLHRSAIKRDLERAEQLQSASIREMDARLGGPYMKNLILAVWSTLEAGDPRSSSPIENTMRVTHPDSSIDEGASTRRYRKLKRSLRFHLERTAETIINNLEYDPDIAEARRNAAFYRHHSDGKHEGGPRKDCPYCEDAS